MSVEKQRQKVPALLFLLALVLVAGLQTQVVYGVELDTVIKVGAEKTAAAQASQRRIDTTVAQSDKLQRQFQLLNKQIEGLQVYNAQLSRQIAQQRQTMADIAESVENAALIERQIIPLSLNMLLALEQFIRLDLPFKIAERQASVDQVRENMDSARFSAAEKSRQVLELYAIEGEYSATIEQFDGVLSIAGQPRQGAFLRVGRIALLFQTANQSLTEVWNKTSGQWQTVAAGQYRRAVANAIRMAKKQAPLDMMTLPLSVPRAVPASAAVGSRSTASQRAVAVVS
ncbi:hypothetical protein A9Q89_01040 [Gammaproteobacteria bacterium 53_120_T64]|nr:hypothetical protein A9Q89_01040 [Gammaproteobacteria bacterium 53_120_T64]